MLFVQLLAQRCERWGVRITVRPRDEPPHEAIVRVVGAVGNSTHEQRTVVERLLQLEQSIADPAAPGAPNRLDSEPCE